MSRLQREKWLSIERSIVEFNCGLYDKNNLAIKRFSRFSSWYYHPGLDLFGPSRFIGHYYTHQNYDGWSSGNDSKILPTYFGHTDYKDHCLFLEKLTILAERHSLKLNDSIIFHIPKQEVIERFLPELMLIEEDIESQESEFMESDEGGQQRLLVNKYERDPQIRKQSILIHGTKCMACGFDFNKTYGEKGRGFIEVHHSVPLHATKGKHSVNPKTDTVVLCANCHRMVHRDRNNPLTLEELRTLLHK